MLCLIAMFCLEMGSKTKLLVPDNDVLADLSKSRISDLEFEVAQMRSTYPAQIEELHRNTVQENIKTVKDQISSLSTPSEARLKNMVVESSKQVHFVPWNILQYIEPELQVSYFIYLVN